MSAGDVSVCPDVAGRPDGPVSPVVVVTGWRDPARVRWLPTLSTAWTDPNAIERPVVSVQALPGHPKPGEMFRELLFALGKSPHVLSGAKTDNGGTDIPAAWLLVRNTRDIIVNDAPQLPTAVLTGLVELAAGVGARIWLIGHHNRAGALDELAEVWAADTWPLERFDRYWQRPDGPRPRRQRTPVEMQRTRLPTSSALTFRADCRRLLSRDAFAQVDALYQAELRQAVRLFSDRQDEGRLNHDLIAAQCRRRVRATGPADDVVVVVRAIEAAALRFGYAVDVELPVLLNAAERNPRPARNSIDEMGALDAYARPAYAAACAAAMCGLAPQDIIDLQVGSFTRHGAALHSNGRQVAVPELLRPYLQAQQLVRRFAGAGDDEPLLLSETGKPVTPWWLARIVKVAETECAVRLTRPRQARKAPTVFEWATTHGITIRSLDSKGRDRRVRR